jgi:hypothetical protein
MLVTGGLAKLWTEENTLLYFFAALIPGHFSEW